MSRVVDRMEAASRDDNLRVCRLCMSKQDLQDIFNATDNIGNHVKLTECRLIELKINDGFPPYICRTCECKLDQYYEFKLQCTDTYHKLKLILNLGSNSYDDVIIKDEPELDVKYESDFADYRADRPESRKEANRRRKRKDRTVDDDFQDDVELVYEDTDLKSTEDHSDVENIPTDDGCGDSTITTEPNPQQKPFQCEMCGFMFKSKSTLKKHMLIHGVPKLYPCNVCSKTYTRKEHRVVHMRSHTGIKPFICEICASAFSKSQDLSRHKRIHSDEKKFPCTICDKKFKRSSDILPHMRTHTGIRPYACKFCLKTYGFYSGLRKHLNVCNGEKKDYDIPKKFKKKDQIKHKNT